MLLVLRNDVLLAQLAVHGSLWAVELGVHVQLLRQEEAAYLLVDGQRVVIHTSERARREAQAADRLLVLVHIRLAHLKPEEAAGREKAKEGQYEATQKLLRNCKTSQTWDRVYDPTV